MYSLFPFTILFSILWTHNLKLIQGELLWKQVGDDIDGEGAQDESGFSVAMSDDGSRMAIGAPKNYANGSSNIGHVRVYQFQDSWDQLGEDIDGDFFGDDFGYSVAMSDDGSRIIIGAPKKLSRGQVRVYQFQDSWEKFGQDIDGEGLGDDFGGSVAMSGDGTHIAIGANLNDGIDSNNGGHVRVYALLESLNSTWVQLGDDIYGEAEGDRSGQSVAMSDDGSRIIIGAQYNNANSINGNIGHARVYEFQDSWEQLGYDIDGEAESDKSGWSVAMSGDGTRIAIGAKNNDGNGSDSGHVRVYELVEGLWEQLGKDIDGEAEGDRFGSSVAMSDDGSRITIGATLNDGNGSYSGHVRVYALLEDSWEQLGNDIDGEAGNDRSGFSVAMSGDGTRITIGAARNDGNDINSGHVRIFELPARCGLYSDLQTKFCRGRANWADKFPIFWTVSLDKNKLKNKYCNTRVCKKSECCLLGPERTCANTGKKGLVCGGFTKQMCARGHKLKGKKQRATTPCTGNNGVRCTVKDCCFTTNPK